MMEKVYFCISEQYDLKLKTVKLSLKSPFANPTFRILFTVLAIHCVIIGISILAFRLVLKSEAHMRFVGIQNTAAEKIAKTAWGMEMNAKNVFGEVGRNLDSPESVIEALQSKADLNPDVRGYFAAFQLNYFPKQGTWFEPYVHRTDSSTEFTLTLVGSARHNYTKSDWYIRATRTHESFWSDPYYYYDGTSISGHYCTFVQPVFNKGGELICVCGADMTFEWLTKDVAKTDSIVRNNEHLNRYSLGRSLDFYTTVLSKDGTCISHPEGKGVTITDQGIISDLKQDRSGMADIEVNGEPCRVYYGPIDHVDWAIAIVVPQHDTWSPLNYFALLLILTAVIGLMVIWRVDRKTRKQTA